MYNIKGAGNNSEIRAKGRPLDVIEIAEWRCRRTGVVKFR